MNPNNLDNLITSLEKDLKEKDEKENLLWIKRQYSGPDEVIDSDLYMKAMKKEKPPFKVFSGIKRVDTIVEGFRPGNLILISGPTKQGKTTFCQTLTYNFWRQKFDALWFSFDTPATELIERFPEKKLPKFYLPKRLEVVKKLEWIEEKIIEGIAKYGIRIVFIDHLESLTSFTSNAPNYSAELQSISKELKQMAIRWNIIILLNHHIRQISANEVPHWTQLKNSSGPAQESDMTIMIWRDRIKGNSEDIYENTANISIQLNRRTGRTGTVKVVWRDNLFYEQPIKTEKGSTIF